METEFINQENEIALRAKIKRISRLLSKQEIARIASVSKEDVDLFEKNKPVNPAARRKLMNAYIFKNTINQYLTDHLYRSFPPQ